jgi:hypothetical protein
LGWQMSEAVMGRAEVGWLVDMWTCGKVDKWDGRVVVLPFLVILLPLFLVVLLPLLGLLLLAVLTLLVIIRSG